MYETFQEQIDYADIMELGFKTEICNDSAFKNTYGIDYKIINLRLRTLVYIDWLQIERTCTMYRMDSLKSNGILKKYPIKNLYELKQIIDFWGVKEPKRKRLIK